MNSERFVFVNPIFSVVFFPSFQHLNDSELWQEERKAINKSREKAKGIE